MGKRKSTVYTNERNEKFNSKEQLVEKMGSDRKDREDKKKIMILENVSGKPINELLVEYGSANMSIRDIAVLANISPIRLQKQIEQGESDFDNDIISEERMMFQSYLLGLKSLEKQVVVENLRFKNPDKLLASINPEKYSDSMQDKLYIPEIKISFGDKDVVEDEEVEEDWVRPTISVN